MRNNQKKKRMVMKSERIKDLGEEQGNEQWRQWEAQTCGGGAAAGDGGETWDLKKKEGDKNHHSLRSCSSLGSSR